MTLKKSQTKIIIGFILPKELVWEDVTSGLKRYFNRPSRKVFWYNLSIIIVLTSFLGYTVGKIQNQINHNDLLQNGIPELEEYRTTFSSIAN